MRTALAVTAAAATATVWLGSPSPAWASVPGPAPTHTVQAEKPRNSPTFLTLAGNALARVQTMYPGAVLLEGRSISDDSNSGNETTGITSWDFVFRLPENRHAVVQATAQGEISEPSVVDRPWLGDQAIPWIPQDFIDLPEADCLLKKAGYTGTYRSVTFRKPLYPGMTEPYFIFGFADGTHIGVGATTGSVAPFR